MKLPLLLVVSWSCFVSSFFQVVSSQQQQLQEEQDGESYNNTTTATTTDEEQLQQSIYDDPYTLNPNERCLKKVNRIVSIVMGIIFGIFVTILPALYVWFVPRAKFARQVINDDGTTSTTIPTECIMADIIHVEKKWIDRDNGGYYEYTPTVKFIITKDELENEQEQEVLLEVTETEDEAEEVETQQTKKNKRLQRGQQNTYQVIGVLPKQYKELQTKQQLELLVSTDNIQLFETKYQLQYDGGPIYKHILCTCGGIIMIVVGLTSACMCILLTLVGTQCFIMPAVTFVIVPWLGISITRYCSMKNEESNPSTFRSTNVTITKL